MALVSVLAERGVGFGRGWVVEGSYGSSVMHETKEPPESGADVARDEVELVVVGAVSDPEVSKGERGISMGRVNRFVHYPQQAVWPPTRESILLGSHIPNRNTVRRGYSVRKRRGPLDVALYLRGIVALTTPMVQQPPAYSVPRQPSSRHS